MWPKHRHQKQLSAAVDRSRLLLAERRHRENLEFLEEVVQQFPDDAEIRMLHGTALLEIRPEDALREIVRAIELDPSEPVRLTNAARTMYTMKQLDHARLYAKRAKELAPEDFPFKPELLNLESKFAALEGKDSVAEKGLRLAMASEPEGEFFAFDLATFLVERGREAEALEVIDKALKRTKEKNYLKNLRTEILREPNE